MNLVGFVKFVKVNMEKYKRIYIFAGHYGSGKTNIAVNMAVKIKSDGFNVNIADLDIVNPYFRTKDSATELENAGIKLVSPAFANTNVDLPALPQEVYGIVQNKSVHAVLDVGGDDRGAYALGRYVPYIKEENDYEMCFVVNFYRPLTTTVEDAIEVMREIEVACNLKFTAIINNSNLGTETTEQSIRQSVDKAKKLSEVTGLKILYTCVEQSLSENFTQEDVFPIKLQSKYFDIKE